jgi:hypothetical protein
MESEKENRVPSAELPLPHLVGKPASPRKKKSAFWWISSILGVGIFLIWALYMAVLGNYFLLIVFGILFSIGLYLGLRNPR